MTTTEYLCRHLSRIGAPLKVQGPRGRQGEQIKIEVAGVVPEIPDLRPALRHVAMVRDSDDENKFPLGQDERHRFATNFTCRASKSWQEALPIGGYPRRDHSKNLNLRGSEE